jgi:hypothetical protein
MKLLTKDIEKRLPKFYSTGDLKGKEKIAQVKFFSCWMPMTWYGVEYDSDSRLFFGYVENHAEPHFSEWGYFSLDEFEEINAEKGFYIIERDLHFTPAKISDLTD